MAPLPKKKSSKRRTHIRRRAHSLVYHLPHFVLCPKCAKEKMSHLACPSCGFYREDKATPLSQTPS